MSIADFLTDEAASLEREFAGLVVADATPRAIRRRRAVRHGATGIVAIVGVVAMALGGIQWFNRNHTEPVAPPSVVAKPDEFRAQLLNPDADPRMSPYAYVPGCGEPAPAIAPEVEGVVITMRSAADRTLDPVSGDFGGSAGAWIDNERAEALRASVSSIAMVWVSDGAVVAYSESPYAYSGASAPEVGFFNQTSPKYVVGNLTAQTYLCGSPLEGPWQLVDTGSYEVYPVVRVNGSYTDAATGDGARVDFALVAPPITVHVESTWEEYVAALAPLPASPSSWQCGDTVTRDEYAYGKGGALHIWGDGGLIGDSESHFFQFMDDALQSQTTVTVPESFDIFLMEFAEAEDSWRIIGNAVVRTEGVRVAVAQRVGEVQSIATHVEDIEFCEAVPENYGVLGDVQVVVTDASGTRTVWMPVR